jgi:hypothetical protein
MISNTCTLEQSSGRLNILVHGPRGATIEVRESYVGVTAGGRATDIVPQPDGSKIWFFDGKEAKFDLPVMDRWNPDARNQIGNLGAFETYADWPTIKQTVARLRSQWGDLPCQVNAT